MPFAFCRHHHVLFNHQTLLREYHSVYAGARCLDGDDVRDCLCADCGLLDICFVTCHPDYVEQLTGYESCTETAAAANLQGDYDLSCKTFGPSVTAQRCNTTEFAGLADVLACAGSMSSIVAHQYIYSNTERQCEGFLDHMRTEFGTMAPSPPTPDLGAIGCVSEGFTDSQWALLALDERSCEAEVAEWNAHFGTTTFFCNQQTFVREYHSIFAGSRCSDRDDEPDGSSPIGR